MTQTRKLFWWRYTNSLVIVSKRVSSSPKKHGHVLFYAESVSCSWTVHERKLRNVERQKEYSTFLLIFPCYKRRKSWVFLSCTFNTFFQDFYSPGGSQSGGHVSIYFIHYLQFHFQVALLLKMIFKNYAQLFLPESRDSCLAKSNYKLNENQTIL